MSSFRVTEKWETPGDSEPVSSVTQDLKILKHLKTFRVTSSVK